MKVHLVRPGEWTTMCGRDFAPEDRGQRTTNVPHQNTCETCKKFYEHNIPWWWLGEFCIEAPAGVRYTAFDIGIPGLFLHSRQLV